MITTNLSTLKIHKLSQEQYNRELAAGRLDENAIYLTPDNGSSDGPTPSVDTSKAVGVWVFNDTLTKINADLTQGQVEIDCVGYAPVNSSARPEQFSKIHFLGGEDQWTIELYLSGFDIYVEFYSSAHGFISEFEEKTLVFLEEIEDAAFMDWLRANATKMPSSIEPGLDTVNKTIVEAINEVNNLTIDKVNYFGFNSGNNYEVYYDADCGIEWSIDEVEIETDNGYVYVPDSRFRVPISPGEGIEFIVDEEAQIVNIGLNDETREAIANMASTSDIPTKVSDLTNDSGFITGYTETDPTVPAWAKASSKPSYTKSEVGLGNVDNVKQYSASNPPPYPVTKVNNKTGAVTLSASDVGADPSGTASSAVSAHNINTSAHNDIRTEVAGKANKSEGAFFVIGSGTTDPTAKTSTWTGTSDRITEYYDGLTIRYKIGVAGQTTTTLDINGFGAKPIYLYNTTKLTTQFPVNSIINLIYHTGLNDGCWMCSDYDSNTNTYQRVYATTTNTEYPITTRYNTTTGASYYAEYGRYSTGVTLNPSTNTITATKFKGALAGNADTATKATQDASGNVITSTYETKADATTKLNEVNAQISQLSSEKVNNPLYGKKVSLLGDSICAGSTETHLGGYGKIIADRNGMVYENVARAGATVTAETYSRSTGNAKPWLCRMVDNMSADADYAIIEGGINDGWDETVKSNIGSITKGYNATLDDTTYYGAFESMLKQLVTKFQGKKIGYIAVPKIHSLFDSNQNAPNFYHIALECCAKWGVSVCDLNTITPPVEYLSDLGTEYTADGTHPTYEGYLKYYCDPIEAWMRTLTTGASVGQASSAVSGDVALKSEVVLKNDVQIKKAQLTLEDGTTVLIDVVVASAGTSIQNYLNLIPTSINADGSIYNDVGWKIDTRLSSTGVEKVTSGGICTGFIPAVGGDVIRLSGAAPWYQSGHNDNYICAYDSNFNYIGGVYNTIGGYFYTKNIAAAHEIGDVTKVTLASGINIAYIRANWPTGTRTIASGADLIVTVNQEIT